MPLLTKNYDAIKRENELLKKEISRLKSQVENLKKPPHSVVYVLDLVGKQAIVETLNRARYLVDIKGGMEIKVGDQAALEKGKIFRLLPEVKHQYIGAMEIIERPDVTYGDVGGLKEQIKEIKEVIELPLQKPEVFKKIGIEPPKGVLFYGPPGTGKTLVTKAIANDAKATFIKVSGSELVQKFIGEGTRLVKDIFLTAKEKSPSIIFIDEIDAIASTRTDDTIGAEREIQRTFAQLLIEMDGFEALQNVKIIAATNRPDIVDRAILRPGRFDRLIQFPLPDDAGRREIFRCHAKNMNLREVNFYVLADKTYGSSGADIKAMCTEAGMFAIRAQRDYVIQDDFEQAVEKVLKEKSSAEGFREWKLTP